MKAWLMRWNKVVITAMKRLTLNNPTQRSRNRDLREQLQFFKFGSRPQFFCVGTIEQPRLRANGTLLRSLYASSDMNCVVPFGSSPVSCLGLLRVCAAGTLRVNFVMLQLFLVNPKMVCIFTN